MRYGTGIIPYRPATGMGPSFNLACHTIPWVDMVRYWYRAIPAGHWYGSWYWYWESRSKPKLFEIEFFLNICMPNDRSQLKPFNYSLLKALSSAGNWAISTSNHLSIQMILMGSCLFIHLWLIEWCLKTLYSLGGLDMAENEDSGDCDLVLNKKEDLGLGLGLARAMVERR